jgi:hypothetical protein
MKKALTFIIFLASFLTGCDKWYTTDDVSHVSYLPKFNMVGGEFISVRRSDSSEFVDPGVTAESDGKSLTVYSPKSDTVNESKIGVYLIRYYATNSDGLSANAERIVSVTEYDVSITDLSGSYQTSIFGTSVESKVKRIDPAGYYECDDVMGYPGFKMPGRFVDIGNDKLVLLHGEGYFGKYDGSEGSYSRSTLSWTIFLIDPPYEGTQIPVIWRKKD